MKDKEKQIEEMAKGFNRQCKTSCYKDKCYTRCGTYKVCEMFYNAGYQKLSEDSVVLSKGAYESLSNKAKANVVNAVEIRKETAERFESELKAFIKVWKMAEDDAMSIPFYKALFEKIGELAKQFGVEIKE